MVGDSENESLGHVLDTLTVVNYLIFFFSKEAQIRMFKDTLWQKNAAEPVRNVHGQITSRGRGVWGVDKDGRPKELPKYIQNARYLAKYSKYDNFYERIKKNFEVKKYRYVTQADGTVTKIPLSKQNIERQARNLDREFKQKYGTRLKKYKIQEDNL